MRLPIPPAAPCLYLCPNRGSAPHAHRVLTADTVCPATQQLRGVLPTAVTALYHSPAPAASQVPMSERRR